MNCTGLPYATAMPSKAPCRAATATFPMSPHAIAARRTPAGSQSNARAIASVTKPSRRPIRRSPVMILIAYVASDTVIHEASICSHSCWRSVAECFPEARAMRSKNDFSDAGVSGSANSPSRIGARHSDPSALPRSPHCRYAVESSSSVKFHTVRAAATIVLPPSERLFCSRCANGLPVKNRAAASRFTSSSERRYAARRSTFSSLPGTRATDSQTSANALIRSPFPGRRLSKTASGRGGGTRTRSPHPWSLLSCS